MFEFLVEKETEARKLSEAEASRVAADVGDLWKDWDEARSKQKAIAEKLRPEIYLDDRPAKDRGEGNWKSDVHLNKIYSLSQTQQAFIWDNIYSNNEKLFDVAGKRKKHRECVDAVRQAADMFPVVYADTRHLNAVICLKKAGFEWVDRKKKLLRRLQK